MSAKQSKMKEIQAQKKALLEEQRTLREELDSTKEERKEQRTNRAQARKDARESKSEVRELSAKVNSTFKTGDPDAIDTLADEIMEAATAMVTNIRKFGECCKDVVVNDTDEKSEDE